MGQLIWVPISHLFSRQCKLRCAPAPTCQARHLPPDHRRASGPAMRYVVLALAVLIVLGAGGFVWLGWNSAIAPAQPPARASFPSAAIAQGATLAALGDCV